MIPTPNPIEEFLNECEMKHKNATPGPWKYEGRSDTDISCKECGEEFPESGYAVKSQDEYAVLECHLYGMERFCKPNGEAIVHAHNTTPKLIEACRVMHKAIEKMNCVWKKEEGHKIEKCPRHSVLSEVQAIFNEGKGE